MKKRWISVALVIVFVIGIGSVIVGSRTKSPEGKNTAAVEKVTEKKENAVNTTTSAILAKAAKPKAQSNTLPRPECFAFTQMLAGNKLAKEVLKPELPDNAVYSPLTLGMAMAMLADASTGETRQEILNTFGWSSLSDLKKMVKSASGVANRKQGDGQCSLANALWLRNDMTFQEKKLKELAEDFYADVFSGEMGAEDYDKLHQDWLNEKTGGLLEDAVKGRKFKEELRLCLSATSYYQQQWPEKMGVDKNRLFLGGASGNTKVDMLCERLRTDYYRGEHFACIGLQLKGNTTFWLFLPDMEYTVNDVLQDDTYLSIMKGNVEPEKEDADVVVQFPRMDTMTNVDAKDALCKLNYLRVFDDRGDFSELTKEELRVSGVPHATRICVDEYGITAASYTEVELEGAAAPRELTYFVCNRPFFYAVSDCSGMVYYEGIMKTGEEIPDDEVKIRRPIVQVNGKIYQKTDELATVTCGVADGRILYAEAADKGLTEDNTSNFGEGYPYQYSDEGHLSVNIDGTWYVFEYVPDISTIYYKPKDQGADRPQD